MGRGQCTTIYEVADLLLGPTRPQEAPNEVGCGIRVATVFDPFGNGLGLIDNPQFAVKACR